MNLLHAKNHKFEYYKYKDLPSALKERLKDLTLPDGWMRGFLKGECNLKHMRNVHIFILYKASQPIGWATAHSIIANPDFTFGGDGRCFEFSIFVAQEYRKSGAGRVLLELAKNKLKKFNRVYTCQPRDAAGHRFFMVNHIMPLKRDEILLDRLEWRTE